ncbi:hypothetical protein [Pseudoxanthomonas sp. CF385]|uniref:hypothetical protein n=1 Tax=Pseudoxanthomonas sp. CF385 TaxID=1881042 RepID=UPI0011146C35|nr:hypothetical protein [Pseudoxanthomonas sp. CF385]
MDMPKGRERARTKWGKEAAYYSGLLCPKHLIWRKTSKMNTASAGVPLKSVAGAVIWQLAWTCVLGFGLFLHYNPGHPLAGTVGPSLGLPLALVAGLMLGLGMAWVVWLAWRITRFLISPRRTIP